VRTFPTCPLQARFLTGQTVAKGLKWLLRGGLYNFYVMVGSLLLKLFSVQGLNWALDRAMSYYTQNPDWWEKLVRKAMKIDFSWDVSADQYVDFYNQIVTNVHATRT
jgi:glycogen synthase